MAVDFLAKLLAPYNAAVQGTPTNVQSLQSNPLDSFFPGLQDLMSQASQARQRGALPTNADGSTFELFYGGNKFNPSASVDPSHQGHLHWAAPHRVIKGEVPHLEKLGFSIGEFGPNISSGHTDNSYHYRGKGKATDVNYYGGGRWDSEQRALNWLEHYLANTYGV